MTDISLIDMTNMTGQRYIGVLQLERIAAGDDGSGWQRHCWACGSVGHARARCPYRSGAT